MGRRGYLTVIAVVLCFFVVAGVGLILRPLTGAGLLVRNHLEGVREHYLRLAAVERVCVLLQENISFSGSVMYDDLGQALEVLEHAVEEDVVELSRSGLEFEVSFDVYSATDVHVAAIGSGEVLCYYPDGSLAFSGRVSGVNEWVIPSGDVYDVDTGECRYGEYRLEVNRLEVIGSGECDVRVRFDRVLWREVVLSVGRRYRVENGFGMGNILVLL